MCVLQSVQQRGSARGPGACRRSPRVLVTVSPQSQPCRAQPGSGESAGHATAPGPGRLLRGPGPGVSLRAFASLPRHGPRQWSCQSTEAKHLPCVHASGISESVQSLKRLQTNWASLAHACCRLFYAYPCSCLCLKAW